MGSNNSSRPQKSSRKSSSRHTDVSNDQDISRGDILELANVLQRVSAAEPGSLNDQHPDIVFLKKLHDANIPGSFGISLKAGISLQLTLGMDFDNPNPQQLDAVPVALKNLTAMAEILRHPETAADSDHITLRTEILRDLIALHMLQFKRQNGIEDLDAAICFASELTTFPADIDPSEQLIPASLGRFYVMRYEHLGKVDDLEHAIEHSRRAVDLTSTHDQELPTRLVVLGHCLKLRFNRYANASDAQEALSLIKRAIGITSATSEELPSRLIALGQLLMARYDRQGNIVDIAEAIPHLQRALGMLHDDNEDKAICCSELGNLYLRRFERFDDLEDVNRAVINHQRAVDLISLHHTKKMKALFHSNLGSSLLRRFKRSDIAEDLSQSIFHYRRAVDFGGQAEPVFFGTLGASLQSRFERLGNIEDVDQAILYLKKAVELVPDSNQYKATFHVNLGTSCFNRFNRLGELEDIDTAVLHHQRSIELTPDGHPQKPTRITCLGSSLISRYDRLSHIEDMNRAVFHYRAALRIVPPGHSREAQLQSNVGGALFKRYERLGNIEDLKDSVTSYRRCVSLTPNAHSDTHLHHFNLGASLIKFYDHTRDRKVKVLEECLIHLQRALETIPRDHPNMPIIHIHLGYGYINRLQLLADPRDLERGIYHHQQAILLTKDDDPQAATWHSGLGLALLQQFENTKALDVINEAISHFDRAIRLTDDDSALKIVHYQNLSSALVLRSNTGDLEEVIEILQKAVMVEHASPRHLFNAYKKLAEYTGKVKGATSPGLLKVYESAISLLPRISWVGVDVKTQLHVLTSAGGLASDAAAVAMASDNLELAVEWLEQARSVVWAHILQLRSPLAEIELSCPDIAKRLTEIWKNLDSPDNAQVNTDQRIHLAMESEELISQVREEHGLGRFLMPKEYSELEKSSLCGPVVILNASRYSCDALVISPGAPLHRIKFEDCTFEMISDIQLAFRSIVLGLDLAGVDMDKIPVNLPDGYSPNDVFRAILQFLWLTIVEPCMAHLTSVQNPVNTGDRGLIHIHWCPTGPFTFLPIHAAGLYDDLGASTTYLSNHAVSSYTPTLEALISSQKGINKIQPKILAIIQHSTPDSMPIPGTKKELKHIRKRTKRSNTPLTTLVHTEGTLENVLTAMPSHSIVHFACHGVQEVWEPLQSRLLLFDGSLSLSQLMKIRMPNAQLAFLSACETAMGTQELPDEAVHLAAGMMAAGFKNVIATMWMVPDETAPDIADQVYAELLSDEGSFYKKGAAAFALHTAVQRLRQSGANIASEFMLWVPFIHVGA